MARLALIEILERDGRVHGAQRVVRWPATIGRALECDVVVGDPYCAPLHLRLDLPADDAAGLVMEVGETFNGARWMGRHLAAGSRALLPGEAQVEIGRTLLRIRTGEADLAPERPLPRTRDRRAALFTAGAALAFLAWTGFTQWLEGAPGAGWDHYLPTLLGVVFACVAWSGSWGLASKLFQHHFRFLPHLRLLLGFALGYTVLELALGAGAYALSWPVLSRLREPLALAGLIALVGAHTLLLLPARRRTLLAAGCGLFLVLAGLQGALNWRHHQRWFNELYQSELPPPALRVARPQPVDGFLQGLRPLEAQLQAQAREDDQKDPAEKFLSEME